MDHLLTYAGLSPKASKLYLTCLQLGKSTVTEVSHASGFKRPSTYLLIEELLFRGFLSSVKEGKKTFYIPENPRRLLQTMKRREKEVEEALPELEAIHYGAKDKPRVQVYKGKKAMLDIYDEMYNSFGKREEALFFSSLGTLMEYFPEAVASFQKTVKEKRREFRIKELEIDDKAARKYVTQMKNTLGPYHEIRLLPDTTPLMKTDNLILGNKLIMFSFKKDIFTLVIEDEDIVNSYRLLFYTAWEMGKKV